MPDTDWDKIIEDEDRIIENSDRKHRNHFKSLEAMSEEYTYSQSIDKYLRDEFDNSKTSFDFTANLQNDKLAAAIRKLTKRQRQAIELYYWHGYKQNEIAVIMDCGQNAVSALLSRAMTKLQVHLSEK